MPNFSPLPANKSWNSLRRASRSFFFSTDLLKWMATQSLPSHFAEDLVPPLQSLPYQFLNPGLILDLLRSYSPTWYKSWIPSLRRWCHESQEATFCWVQTGRFHPSPRGDWSQQRPPTYGREPSTTTEDGLRMRSRWVRLCQLEYLSSPPAAECGDDQQGHRRVCPAPLQREVIRPPIYIDGGVTHSDHIDRILQQRSYFSLVPLIPIAVTTRHRGS